MMSPRSLVSSRRLQHFFLISLLALLTACGGGGGSGDDSPTNQPNPQPDPDTTPASFSFTSLSAVAPGTVVTSEPVTIEGIDAAAPVTITGGEYAIDNGTYTSGAGEINSGETITIQLSAADSHSTESTATVTVGGVSATFTVTTAPDTTPDSLSLGAQDGAYGGVTYLSNTVVISGIEVAVPVSIEGGEYTVGDGIDDTFTSAPGQISAGDQLTLRGTAPSQPASSQTVTVTLGEGESAVSSSFVITTLNDTSAPEAAFVFPPPMSAFDGDTLTVRGTAKDDLTFIANVRVFVKTGELSTEATVISNDEFETWKADVALSADAENVITVQTVDAFGNTNETAAQVTVVEQSIAEPFPASNEPHAQWWGITYDPINEQALLIDENEDVWALDMATAERRRLSGSNFPEGEGALGSLQAIVFDRERGQALLADLGEDTVFTMDLVTGRRGVLSNYDSGVYRPTALTMDPNDSDVAYVINEEIFQEGLFRLDLVSGEMVVVSNHWAEFSGPDIRSVHALFVTADSSKAIAFDESYRSAIAVDLATGNRETLREGMRSFSVTRGLQKDVIIISDEQEGIKRWDLMENSVTPLPTPKISDDFVELHRPENSQYVLVAGFDTDVVYALDLETYEVVTLARYVPATP